MDRGNRRIERWANLWNDNVTEVYSNSRRIPQQEMSTVESVVGMVVIPVAAWAGKSSAEICLRWQAKLIFFPVL